MPYILFQAGDRTTQRQMNIITTAADSTNYVTVQASSYAETWFEFLAEVDSIRRDCQPRKGRSLIKYGDFIISFPHMMIPSITVRVREAMGGAGVINSRVTYLVKGKKASKLDVMRLWA